MKRVLIVGTVYCVLLSGCNPVESPSKSGALSGPFHGLAEDIESEMRVTCAEASCPESAGVMIGYRHYENQGDKIEVISCGATLTETRDQITTAGHCDPFIASDRRGRPWERILFVTTSVPGKPAEVRDVTRSLFNVFKVDHPEFPDVSTLALESPILSRKALPVARKSVSLLNQFKAFVADRVDGDGHLHFVMKAKVCKVLWQTLAFPFVAMDRPDTLLGWDCEMGPTNSGAPIFFDNQIERLDGIVSGGDNSSTRNIICERKKGVNCPPLSSTKDQATGTPLACQKIPGASPPEKCSHFDTAALNEKREELFRMQEALQVDRLVREDAARGLPYIRWPIPFELKAGRREAYYGIPREAYGFYLFMIPRCLLRDERVATQEFDERAHFFSVRKDSYTRLISERNPAGDIPVRTTYSVNGASVKYRYGLRTMPAPGLFLDLPSDQDRRAVFDLMRGQAFALHICP